MGPHLLLVAALALLPGPFVPRRSHVSPPAIAAVARKSKRISGTNRQKELKPFREGGKFSYSFEPGSRYLSWSEAGGGRDAAGGASKKFAAMSKATPPVSAASTTKASTVKAPDNATPQISEYAANKRGNNLGIVWND